MSTLETYFGFWTPTIFILFFCLAMLLCYLLSLFAKKGFAYSKNKAQPFVSGNAYSELNLIRASDYFWGFFKATENYYDFIKSIHTGLVNDYISWFIGVISVMLIVVFAGVIIWG